MTKALTFGWTTNAAADGFEQEHGAFTAEVYWDDGSRIWKWVVWGDNPATGIQGILIRGHQELLSDAKKDSLRRASILERDRMKKQALDDSH